MYKAGNKCNIVNYKKQKVWELHHEIVDIYQVTNAAWLRLPPVDSFCCTNQASNSSITSLNGIAVSCQTLTKKKNDKSW